MRNVVPHDNLGSRCCRANDCPTTTLRRDRDDVPTRRSQLQIIINGGGSLLPPLPPATLVGLPIGDIEPPGLAIGPGPPRCRKRVGVVAVKDHDQPRVAVAIRRQNSIVDQEPDTGPVRITSATASTIG